MSVEIKQETAKDLITFKLEHLSKLIDSILAKWNQNNIEEFLSKARSGELENAELDAISLKQINFDYQELKNLHLYFLSEAF